MNKFTLLLSLLLAFLFCTSQQNLLAQAPANDACADATDLNSSLGSATTVVAGPFTNNNATVEAGLTAPACFGEPTGNAAAPEINNSVWFTFTGDGNLYFIETSDCGNLGAAYIEAGDTQIAIYTGDCGSLTEVACNEDGPSATATLYPAGLEFLTESGVEYTMMIDGFNFQGDLSEGDFCIEFTLLSTSSCTEASTGTTSAPETNICFNDTLLLSIADVVVPNASAASGFAWIVSTADISGSTAPNIDPSFAGNFPIQGASYDVAFINDALQIPAGVYYFTPLVFGGATTGASFAEYVLDPACTFTGQSVMVNFLAAGNPDCGGGGFNDECADAVNLNSFLGSATTAVAGPYTNNGATVEAGLTAPACFGEPTGNAAAPEINNSVWFTFTGDGNAYFIETSDCGNLGAAYIEAGDTQIAIYTGDCGSLTEVACNEDGPNATADHYPAGLDFQTEAGVEYTIMVDGFNFQGDLSEGDFCIEFTLLTTSTCAEASFGTATTPTQNICFNDTLHLSATGVVVPNASAASGFAWIVSTADISGSTAPNIDPNFAGNFPIQGASYDIAFINNALQIPAGVYYFTPVVFGGATTGAAFSDYILDPACTFTGQSIMFTLFEQGSLDCVSACPVTNVVVSDCVDGQFTVSVDVVSFGQNTSVQVSENGNQVVSATQPGSYEIGTYPSGTTVVIEISTQTAACNSTQEITKLCPVACDIIADGSFEGAGWEATSTNFGTPLCDGGCSGGTSLALDGEFWAWFGGVPDGGGTLPEDGTLSQNIVIPASDAELSFYVGTSGNNGTASDYLRVTVDGTEVFNMTSADSLEYPIYTPVTVSLAAFADGEQHTLAFESSINAFSAGFFLDFVSLSACADACAAEAGVLDATVVAPNVTATATGFAPAPNYQYVYILTQNDANFTIIATNSTGLFTLAASGTYVVHGLSISTNDAGILADISTGAEVLQAIGAGLICAELSSSVPLQVVIIGVEAAQQAGFAVTSVSPAPAQNTATVQFSHASNATINATLHDVTGRVVNKQTLQAHNGNNACTVDLSNCASGMYYLSLNDGLYTIMTKIVKQ